MGTSVGKIARKVLGRRLFHAAGRYYTRLFGDYGVIARVIIDSIPPASHVLDIGGGDGAPLNFILKARPDLRVTMIDVAPRIGGAIAEEFRSRVKIFPNTTLQAYCERCDDVPAVALVLDVMHHIPPHARPVFAKQLRELLELSPGLRVIFKDIEPDGSLSAKLNYLADRYISNDRNTNAIGHRDLIGLLHGEFGPALRTEQTDLYSAQPPHYALLSSLLL